MKILFVTKFIPLPKSCGGKIGSYNLLQSLCKFSEVDYISFYENKDEINNITKIKEICSNVKVFYKEISIGKNRFKNYKYIFNSIIKNKPYFIEKFYSKELSRYINSIDLFKYDLIVIDGLNLVQYFSKCKNKMLLQEHNIEFEILYRYYKYERNLFKRSIYYNDYRKLKKYEINSIKKIKNIIYFTERDKENMVKNIDFKQNAFIIPVAVDESEFFPLKKTDIKFEFKVYSNGSLKYTPNFEGLKWFDKEVIPIIKEKVKDFNLYHIGSYNSEQRKQLSDNIVLLGYVDDIRKYMNSNIIHIVPLKIGGGIRVKILNSMSSGIPIVATTMAAEGICVKDGESIFLADTAEDFANKLINLMNDSSLRMKFINNEKKITEKYYNLKALENIIKKTVNQILEN